MSTVLWLEGFENEQINPVLGDAYQQFDIGNGGFVTDRFAEGSAYRFPTDLGALVEIRTNVFAASTLSQISIGFYMNFVGSGQCELVVAPLVTGGAAVGSALKVGVITTDLYRLSISGSTIGATVEELPKGEWIQIEFRVSRTVGAVIGRSKLYVAGFLVLDVEVDFPDTLEGVLFLLRDVGVTDVVQLDDIYIHTGGMDDPALPDYRVLGLLPVSDGTFQDSAPSTGTVRAEVVDNIPTDATPDTDFTTMSGTGADSYVLDQGTASSQSVLAAQCRIRAKAALTVSPGASVRVGTTVVGTMVVPSTSFTQEIVDLTLPSSTSMADLTAGSLGVKAP